MINRAEREKKAYDEGNIQQHSNKLHMKFRHVFESPNTIRHEKIFIDIIKGNIFGKRLLDIGCGLGISSWNLYSLGALYVHGVDISKRFISEAKKKEIKGELEFSNKNIMEPIEETYDIIFGRAILHHIDYRTVLKRLYCSNLNHSGIMIFMEPLGSNLLLRLFYFIAKSAHTPDERSFLRQDLRWLRENFEDFEIIPINYLSLVFGILSSMIFSNPYNYLMRLSDKIDCWLGRNIKLLIPNFRAAIFIIKKK